MTQALEEREFRVEVGDGLEGILPDGKTGRFQDQYIIPYLRNDDFSTGLVERKITLGFSTEKFSTFHNPCGNFLNAEY